MKKLAAILVLALVISLTASAVAEVDIEGMDLTELLELELKVQQRIFELDNFSNNILYPGKYDAGVDIELGTYIFQGVSITENSSYVIVVRYSSEGHQLDSALIGIGEPYQMKIDDGDYLRVDNGVASYLKR